MATSEIYLEKILSFQKNYFSGLNYFISKLINQLTDFIFQKHIKDKE